VGLGLLAGLLVAGYWPSVPLHAVASDRVDNFSMATGLVGDDYEAVYFLDHLTGDLHAFVVGRIAVRAATGFGVIEHCYRNVLQDFKVEEDKTPKFLMVTGLCDLARGGVNASMPSKSLLYVADVRSGTAAAYGIPCNPNQHNQGQFIETNFLPIAKFPIRKVTAKK
jgi:hypothetical protein